MGISTSRLCDRRAYRGRIDGEYRMRASSVASRSRTRGWRTATGPMPVMISRSGRWPWRTTRCWPVSVLRSACFARNSATSASTAWVSRARAPLRRISVRESVKTPGWASLMTLVSDTAYHSFIGEVEALNTTTIRRLTPSRRHQLLAIAPGAMLLALVCVGWLLFFIHHISRSISVNHIVDRIARETELVIDELMPHSRAGYYRPAPVLPEPAEQEFPILNEVSGYIRFLDTRRLVEFARTHQLRLRVTRQVGHFVPAGVPLLMVSRRARIDRDRAVELTGAFDIGPMRTLQQDVEFGSSRSLTSR